jgi:4-hydroxy-tetrahydrodipicolinate synthase
MDAISSPLHGVLPIVQTPFLDSGAIDFATLQREIDWAFAQGIDGLGTGMVSEILRLTTAERHELSERLVEFAAGRGSVFMAVTADDAAQALGFARIAEQVGCQAVMAAPPPAGRLNSTELFAFYRTLADGVTLPVIVQDASGYLGQAIPLAVFLELLDQYGPEKILFKPEAPPIGTNLSALRDSSGGKARIYEGSGGILLIDSFRRGIAGTMPGMEVVDGIVAIWQALSRGDDALAYRLYYPICAMIALQLQAGLDGFLAIEKHLLVGRGLFPTAHRRPPIAWQLDRETAAEIDRLFEQLQLVLTEIGPAAEG